MTRVNIRRAWFSVKQTTGGDCGMFVMLLLTDVLPITTTFDSYCVPHTHILNEGNNSEEEAELEQHFLC